MSADLRHLGGGLLIVVLGVLACDTRSAAERRTRRAATENLTDKTIPMDVRVPFHPPQTWEHVQLPAGVEFHQPPGFTIVNSPAIRCDDTTMPDSLSVLRTDLSNSWPLTLAMRRGDLARIGRANGFIIDSSDIVTAGQSARDTTLVRRGEGWMLLSGKSAGTEVLLASVRAPNGCYLLWVGRGFDINVDTLGLVLGTVRFVSDTSSGATP